MSNTVKVTLVKSVIGTKQSHRDTVVGLGLKRMNSSKVLVDTPEVRHDQQGCISFES